MAKLGVSTVCHALLSSMEQLWVMLLEGELHSLHTLRGLLAAQRMCVPFLLLLILVSCSLRLASVQGCNPKVSLVICFCSGIPAITSAHPLQPTLYSRRQFAHNSFSVQL